MPSVADNKTSYNQVQVIIGSDKLYYAYSLFSIKP